ncbi:ATP-dependent translocase ABCB1-like isoform X1 [Lampetra planeri]
MKDEKKKYPSKKTSQPVRPLDLFRFADRWDIFLMVVGTLSAVGHGVTYPILFMVFGDMTSSFVDFGKVDQCQGNFSCIGNILANVTFDIEDKMTEYAYSFMGGGAAVMVLGTVQVACWAAAGARQAQRVRRLLFRSILRQDAAWFDSSQAGELGNCLTDNVMKMQDGMSDQVSVMLQLVARFAAGLGVGFSQGWKLSLVIMAVSPLIAGTAGAVYLASTALSRKELAAYGQAGAIASEVLSNIRTVVAFGGEAREVERYSRSLAPASKMGLRKSLINGFGIGMTMLVVYGTYGLAFWYGTTLVLDPNSDDYTVGTLITVFFSVLIGASSLGEAASQMEYISTARAAATPVLAIIKRTPAIDSAADSGRRPSSTQGHIRFRALKFSYPTRPDVQVLNGLDLEVRPGQTVALVGPSGCGKSTCVQLLQRLYDPQDGQVLLDGEDVRELNVHWLRERVAVVSQEPVLFGCSIAENIAYGREGVSRGDVERAAREAYAYDFIAALPEGFETPVGERGTQLSGGQKQRIAIARALVRDPRVLVLDEATSALDTASEGIVQAALDRARRGRTTLVIAHRLSTVQSADTIAVLEGGAVAEMGSHEELLQRRGIYFNLTQAQSSGKDAVGVAEPPREDRDAGVEEGPGDRLALAYIPVPVARTDKGASPDDGEGIEELTVAARDGNGEEEQKEDEDEKKAARGISFLQMLRLNAPEWPYILLGIMVAAVNGAIQPVFAIIFAELIGTFTLPTEEEQRETSVFWCLMFIAIGGSALVVNTIQGYTFGKSGEVLTQRLRERSFKAMVRQEISWFDNHKNNTGALTAQLSTDAAQVQGATGRRAGMLVQNVSGLTTGLLIALLVGWKLALLMLAFMPFMVGAGLVQSVLQGSEATTIKRAYEQASKISTEAVQNIRTVASLCLEEKFSGMFEQCLLEPYRVMKRRGYLFSVTFGFTQGILCFAYAAVFRLGGFLVAQGELTFQDVYKVFGAIIFGAMAVGQAMAMAPNYGRAKVSAARILALLRREMAIDSYSEGGIQPDAFDGELQLSGVHFRYPTRPHAEVLRGVSLRVSPGQTLALVGPSGSGKSTIMQLLLRFYDSSAGQLLLNGVEVRQLNLGWLRRQLGVVSQEPVLFGCSIAENIAYGDVSRAVSRDEVVAAARAANLHDFVESLPQAYDTVVGERGAQLSGGQKQRVAIARALLRDPRVLLLDEATSALDAESEKVVQDALEKAQQGRTCIVIAHRLSTVRAADVIAVLQDGDICELGSHEELLSARGLYYRLVEAQIL